MYWPECGRLEIRGAFPAIPDLAARSQADGVGNSYLHMRDGGELVTLGAGRMIPVGAFVAELAEMARGEDVVALVCDRFRPAELQDALAVAGIHWRVIFRGQGTREGGEDVRAFQRAVAERRVLTRPGRLLRSAIGESHVVFVDAARNPKLDKRRGDARIDALAATLQAVGYGTRLVAPRRTRVFAEPPRVLVTRLLRGVYGTRRWRAVRVHVLDRDGWRCAQCGRAGRLEVHHVRKAADAPELAFAPDNLTTLCYTCHASATREERLPPDIAEWAAWLAQQKS